MRPAGWSKPPQSRKYHYFPADEHRALCNGWLYSGERDDSMDEHRENCAVCKKKMPAYRKAQGKAVT